MTAALRAEPFPALAPELVDGLRPDHAILAFLFAGSATSSEIGDALGMGRTRVWQVASSLSALGFVTEVRQRWAITQPGRDKFRRFIIACNYIIGVD